MLRILWNPQRRLFEVQQWDGAILATAPTQQDALECALQTARIRRRQGQSVQVMIGRDGSAFCLAYAL